MLSSGQVLKELNNQYTKSDLQLQTGFFYGHSQQKSRIGLFAKFLFGLTPESAKPKLET